MSTEGAAEWRASKLANKQAKQNLVLSDQQFQDRHNEIQSNIENLQTKLSSVPESDRNNPDYLKLKDQHAQAIQDRDEHWKSLEHPNAILKFSKMLGRDLHFPQKEAPVAVAPPVYGQPTMNINGEKVPTGPAYKVQGPQTPAQVKAQKEAGQLEAAAPMSPEQAAQTKSKAEWAGSLATLNSANELWNQQNPDATPGGKRDAQYENYRTLVLGDRTASTRPNNNPDIKKLTLTDGKDISAQWNPAANGGKGSWQYLGGGEIPQDVLNGAQVSSKPSKLVKGDLIRVKPGQSPTGWVRILYDATDPTKRKYIPATPSRLYMGTESNDVTTDPFGITSTSTRTTKPMNQSVVDLAGMGIPMASTGEYDATGEEVPTPTPAPPPSAPPVVPHATPAHSIHTSAIHAVTPHSNGVTAKPKIDMKALKLEAEARRPQASSAPISPRTSSNNPRGSQFLPVDVNGFIPDTDNVNANLKEGANQLLDGVAMKDITLPTKDKPAAEALARKYGWEQGAFTPREIIQLNNAEMFIDDALNSNSFMKALDEGSLSSVRTSMATADPSKEGVWGRGIQAFASKGLNKDEQEYRRLSNNMTGTIAGLSSILRSGRATEGLINRVKLELPNVLTSSNSKDAKKQLLAIKKEINMALNKNSVRRRDKEDQAKPSGGTQTPNAPSSQIDIESMYNKALETARGKK